MSRLFFIPQAVRINSAGLPYANAYASFTLTGSTTDTDTYEENSLTTPHANPVVADAGGQFPAIYLDPDITYRVRIYDEDDVLLDDVDPVHAPFAASAITVADSGGYFAGSDIETVLQDIGANYAVLADDEAISGDWTVSGSMDFLDNELVRPMIKDYGLKTQVVTSASNAITIDVQLGNSVTHLLTENTTITPSNPTPDDDLCQMIIQITQDGAGGAYTVAWDTSVVWGGGSAPTMSTGNDAVDVFLLKTWDGGTTWFGDYVQNYS